MSETEEEPILSSEELAKRKQEMLAYYDEQLPFLTKQKEYETVITEIEELRMRRIYAQVKIGNMLAPEPEEVKEPRKLKQQ